MSKIKDSKNDLRINFKPQDNRAQELACAKTV